MVGNLFREEALRDKESTWFGKVKITSPPSHRILSFIALAISVCTLAFLILGHFTRRQEATGYLVPSFGMLNISSPSAATVLATFVTSGQKVVTGQRLLTLSSDLDSDVLGPMNAYILQSLRSKKAILSQEISDRKRLTETQVDALKIKVALLRVQLGQIQGQIDIQRNIVFVTEALLMRFRRVSSEGFISGLQMQQQESTAYQAQSILKSLLVQYSQIELQVADSESQLEQLPTELATELNATRSSLADIDQAEARSAADQTLVLKAPRSGIVSAMLVTPGQAVRDGQQILSITPTGSTLQAQFLVPSKSIGFLHPGDRLNLRYDAFPYQEFGQSKGTILSISHGALTPSEVAGLTESRTDDPLYQVLVELDRQTVNVYGRPVNLLAGLKLEASIKVDRRRLIEWIFEPLLESGQSLLGASQS